MVSVRQGCVPATESEPLDTGRVPQQRHTPLLYARQKGLVQAECEDDCARNGLPPRPFKFHQKAVLTFADELSDMTDRRKWKISLRKSSYS